MRREVPCIPSVLILGSFVESVFRFRRSGQGLGFGLRGFSSVRPNGGIFSKQGLRSVKYLGIVRSG
ncbi:MAG: hypothetical protein RL240_4341 [Planctomycetota bacterium]